MTKRSGKGREPVFLHFRNAKRGDAFVVVTRKRVYQREFFLSEEGKLYVLRMWSGNTLNYVPVPDTIVDILNDRNPIIVPLLSPRHPDLKVSLGSGKGYGDAVRHWLFATLEGLAPRRGPMRV